MATDEIKYLSYEEAVLIHIRLMNALEETRFGIDFRVIKKQSKTPTWQKLARSKNYSVGLGVFIHLQQIPFNYLKMAKL